MLKSGLAAVSDPINAYQGWEDVSYCTERTGVEGQNKRGRKFIGC